MAIPVKYNFRNLFVRKVSTGMTVFVIALVVTVFVVIMSLVEGIQKTLSKSVSDRNVVVMRTGAQSEMQSFVAPDQIETLRTLPGVEHGAQGEALASPELVALINTPKRDGTKTNLQVRGVELPVALEIRPTLRLVQGRLFHPGTDEALVSESVAQRFADAGLGSVLKACGLKPAATHLLHPAAALRELRWARRILPAIVPLLERRLRRKLARQAAAPATETPSELFNPDIQVY